MLSEFHRWKGNQRIDNSAKNVTVHAGDSIIKDIKGWKVSFRKNDFLMQHLPDAKTDHMKS